MISEFPLFVFTTFAGLAAGAYVMSAAFPKDADDERPWIFPLAMLVLLGIGLLGCLGHLHHPERFMNALWNPMAGITQEAYLSILFGIVLVIDLVMCAVKGAAPRALRIVGAAFGFLLTCVMGYAYSTTLGVAAWSTPVTIPLFVVGDLAMGSALWAILKRGAYEAKAYTYTACVVEALFACTLVAVAMHFAGLGFGVIPFVAAIVLAPVAHIALAIMALKGNRRWIAPVAFACVLVGVAVARYAFYAAYVM
ncbi:MAG: dimethyl sulfoxide reductase anchor subunit [Eggerthellaceae bacterium]|nr:dimethyl sulfoxide reductase anchor subunit [Eggerthellaceae bacterium]